MSQRKLLDVVITSLAAFAVLIGLLSKVMAFTQGQGLNAAGAILFYLLMFSMFVFRRASHESLTHPAHYAVALAGTLLPLALQLTPMVPPLLMQIALPLQVVGIVVSIVALATLGRGFGILAANRQIKTQGLYRYVRHPLYMGEELWFGALVLQNFSMLNAVLFVVQLACQIQRIRDEESLLLNDPIYATYATQVRYRLLPGLF